MKYKFLLMPQCDLKVGQMSTFTFYSGKLATYSG